MDMTGFMRCFKCICMAIAFKRVHRQYLVNLPLRHRPGDEMPATHVFGDDSSPAEYLANNLQVREPVQSSGQPAVLVPGTKAMLVVPHSTEGQAQFNR